MSDWQPIETAPRDGMILLVWGEARDIDKGRWSVRYERWRIPSLGLYPNDVTHWLPLPAVPEPPDV